MQTATQAVTLQTASRLRDDLVLGAQFTTAFVPATGNSGTSLVSGTNDLRLSGWGIGLTRFNALAEGDRFALTASEPLAVRSGSMLFSVPTGTDINNISYRQEVVGLAGSARERLYEATWMLPFDKGNASVMLSAGVLTRPHCTGALSAAGAGAGAIGVVVRMSQGDGANTQSA